MWVICHLGRLPCPEVVDVLALCVNRASYCFDGSLGRFRRRVWVPPCSVGGKQAKTATLQWIGAVRRRVGHRKKCLCGGTFSVWSGLRRGVVARHFSSSCVFSMLPGQRRSKTRIRVEAGAVLCRSPVAAPAASSYNHPHQWLSTPAPNSALTRSST
jgi:hypothetical protein